MEQIQLVLTYFTVDNCYESDIFNAEVIESKVDKLYVAVIDDRINDSFWVDKSEVLID